MEVPTLVPGAVRLGEYLSEKVPIARFQVMERESAFLSHAFKQVVTESSEVLQGAPVGVAGCHYRVCAEASGDACRKLPRPRFESVERIVRSPLDDLDAVQSLRD